MSGVLLVEDSATIRYLITQALAKRGIAVHPVENPGDVLAAAKSQLPGVVIINKMLPGRDGYSVIRELRATPETSGVRIMMLTESKRREDVMKSIQGGADDYVIKPFDAEDVAKRVEALLRRTGV